MAYKLFRLLLIILFITSAAYGQTTIKGQVKEAKSGKPLPGVHVFLAQTTIGSVTGKDGTYSFKTEVSGVYDLVFSFVGFEKKVITLNIDASSPVITKEIEMKEEVFDLPEVEVVTSNKEWQKNLQLFRSQFIGKFGYADETNIMNPWVLEFDNTGKSNLVATTLKPLEIENHALGYRIYLELDAFSWNYTGTQGFFKIYPKFEEMDPPNRRTRRKWERNRENMYEGSFQHFLKSLYDGNLGRQQFSISQPAYLLELSENEAKFELLARKGVSRKLQRTLKGYKLIRQVDIIYGQKSGYNVKRLGQSLDVKQSTLIPNSRQGIFFVDELGNLLEPTSIKLDGEWARYRMAHRLPLDYSKDR